MRMGRKNRPFYRIVVIDARKPRTSRYKEAIGYYDPIPNPSTIELKLDRYEYWVSKGAQPSDSVRNLVRALKKKHSSASSSS